jgi:pimeloyl-ACP methyl ester carboxylesterase
MSTTHLSQITVGGFPGISAGKPGRRPNLMFVHGAFNTHESWRPWLEFFAERGWHGLATSFSGRLGIGPDRGRGRKISDYVEDVAKVVASLEEPPVLIGHSMGGLIVQKLAEMGMAKAAVLLAPAPPFMLPAQLTALPALAPMFPRILAGLPVRPTYWGCRHIVLNNMPPEACPIVHGKLVHDSGRAYREMVFGTYRVDTAKVKCPVYVVAAENDRVISPRLARKIAKLYGAEYRCHANHAHWLLGEEGWEAIAQDVCDWLERRFVAEHPHIRQVAAAA